jgi:hypothetical protein
MRRFDRQKRCGVPADAGARAGETVASHFGGVFAQSGVAENAGNANHYY